MPDPILSIVTPCLNQATWLDKCLSSVAIEAERVDQEVGVGGGNSGGNSGGNGWKNAVEHIIMDGGSTDGSAAIIEAHALRHPGLVTHWVSESDGGQSDAINRGLAVARGRFATWLNGDDWYEPGGLLALVRAINANPDADVIVGRCRFINVAGETIWHPAPPEPMSAANFLKLRTHWFNAKMIVQPEAIFRLSAFRAIGGLNVDNHYSMDHELWIELALSGARFMSIDAPVACLRVHSGQKSADNRSVVRSMLVTGERVVGGHPDALGDELVIVRGELDAVSSKLHLADALIARFDVARALGAGDASGEGGDGSTVYPLPQGGASQAGEARARVESELRALAQPHTRRALKLAAKHVGKRVRICVHTATPEVLNAELSHVFRKVTLVGEGKREGKREGIRDQASGTGKGQGVESNRKGGPSASAGSLAASRIRKGRGTWRGTWRGKWGGKWGGVDVAVLDNRLATEENPERAIQSLWASLHPGGVLVVLNELIPARGLMGYLDSLEVHLNNHLAANNDLILHPDADAYLLNIDQERDGPHESSDDFHQVSRHEWHARFPSCLGVDIVSIMANLAPDAVVLMTRTHGSYWFHPLAPFPFVPTEGLPQQDTRLTGLWVKPRV